MNIFKKFFANKPDREVQNRELVDYAIGVAGQNHAYNLVTAWFMYFCTDVMFIDTLLVGIILGVARVWDAINDPIVGVICDRHTFKNGEKLRPFLKLMAIPVGLMTALMFIDFGLPAKYSTIYIVVVYFLWDFFYSFQDIAQWGMTAMISTHSDERARAAQFGRIGGMIGGWLPGLIPLMIGNLPQFGISEKTIFLVCGIVFGLGGMALSMFTARAKERVPVIPPQGSMKDAFKLIFSNKIAMTLVIANILSCLTLYVQDIYFFKYMVSVNLFGKEINGLNVKFVYGFLVGLPGTLSIFVATWFAKKIGGMKRLLVLATVLNIITRVVAFFVGFDGYKIAIVGALMAIAGIPNGMMGIASTTLWGDSLDYMEWKTGQRNEASVFALQNLVAKIGTAISTFFTGVTLKILMFDASRYDAGLPQEPIFYKLIWPIYILAPAIGSLFYLIPILMMKYDEKQKKKIEEELKARRARNGASGEGSAPSAQPASAGAAPASGYVQSGYAAAQGYAQYNDLQSMQPVIGYNPQNPPHYALFTSPVYKIPKHNSLEGQILMYEGQPFMLTQHGPVYCPVDMPAPKEPPTPKVTLNPTMRFEADDNGKLVLRINPNPTLDYGDAPITPVPFDPNGGTKA